MDLSSRGQSLLELDCHPWEKLTVKAKPIGKFVKESKPKSGCEYLGKENMGSKCEGGIPAMRKTLQLKLKSQVGNLKILSKMMNKYNPIWEHIVSLGSRCASRSNHCISPIL
ncbi:HTH domain-containing protein [Sesbania bispinosa]|nr:HTH domain-containing protein [Sesbania bispinosa]